MNTSRLLTLAALAAVAVSCDNGNGGGTPLTPEENKERLERVGMDVINMINPANHQDFCEAVDHFVEFSDEGYLGDTFHDPNAYSLMASTMKALEDACTKGDVHGLITKAEVTDYIYRAKDYYGVYEYSSRDNEWKYTSDEEKLEFRYSFDGKDVVATAVSSGNESLVSYTDKYGDRGDEYEDNYEIYVPEKVEVNITMDGKSLASLTVTTDCQMNDHVKINTGFAVADMDGNVNISLDNSNGAVTYSLNMSGRSIVKGTASFSGSDMVDPDEVVNDTENAVRGAEAEVIILDEVKVYGKCTNVAGYIGKMDDLDNEYRHMAGSYYYWTKDYNEENAELFNEYFTFELSYIPDNTRVASLFVQKYFDEDLYYWDSEIQDYTNGGYSTEPVIKFDIDGSEFSIESYFSESNFGSIVDSVEDLGDIYEGYFPYCFGY